MFMIKKFYFLSITSFSDIIILIKTCSIRFNLKNELIKKNNKQKKDVFYAKYTILPSSKSVSSCLRG
jgi:hypothetical protein